MRAKNIQKDYRNLALGHATGADISERYVVLNDETVRKDFIRQMSRVARFDDKEVLDQLFQIRAKSGHENPASVAAA